MNEALSNVSNTYDLLLTISVLAIGSCGVMFRMILKMKDKEIGYLKETVDNFTKALEGINDTNKLIRKEMEDIKEDVRELKYKDNKIEYIDKYNRR